MKQLTQEQQFERLADFAMRRRTAREVGLFCHDCGTRILASEANCPTCANRLDSTGTLERILLRTGPPDRRR